MLVPPRGGTSMNTIEKKKRNYMKNFVSILQSFAVFAGVIALATAAFMGLTKVDTFLSLREQQVRNEAIDACAHSSKYTVTESNGSLTKVFEEPNQGVYQKCLDLKKVK